MLLLLALGLAAFGATGWGAAAAPAPASQTEMPAPDKSRARAAEALGFADAVDQLTVALFAHAKFDPADAAGRTLVIDPLIDHASGDQAVATQAMEPRMISVVNERFGAIKMRPFDAESLADKPLILMGSIAPVSAPGIHPFTTAPTRTYRMWAVIADLRTHRIISHESVWVRADEADMTPTPFFRDSPVWLVDHSQEAYLKTCAGHPGDAMDPAYVEGLPAAASIAAGIKAYEAGRYNEALTYYIRAETMRTGGQLRTYNGAYLANAALRRRSAAEKAFGDLVDYGLQHGKLAVKFLFRPGNAQFWPDQRVSGSYPMWLRQIAARTVRQPTCLRLVGHTSATGLADRNQVLSFARAGRVRTELVHRQPPLGRQVNAVGRGSMELLVGSGRDDATDVLDRRVEFETRPCLEVSTEAPSRS